MNNQNVIILDIETSAIKASVWDTKDQFISLNQINEDWRIIAFAAKKLGAPASQTVYYDLRKGINDRNERKLLQKLWTLLDSNDIVITQNGKSFDGPKINARLIMHRLPPPSPYKHLDTYLVAKGVAKFTSNKLEYLTEKLNVKYKKLSHSKFPGMSLWNQCEKGNIKAWDEMKRYNIHDVLSTEELYQNLSKWAPNNTVKPHLCAKPVYISQGIRSSSSGAYRRNYCIKCNQLFKEYIDKK